MRRPRRWRGFPHVLRMQQFQPEHLDYIFHLADEIRADRSRFSGVLNGVNVAVLFNQDSSRTRITSHRAAAMLGAAVHVEPNMEKFSSVAKGESLGNTIDLFRVLEFDYFFIRWKTEGSVAKIARELGRRFPIINCGDGPGQHPTQGLLDLKTIKDEFGTLNRKLRVGFCGDLSGSRTAHSLVYGLSKYPQIEFVFISPPMARMKPGIIRHLRKHRRKFSEHTSGLTPEVVRTLDVLYMIRPQTEYQDKQEDRDKLVAQYRRFILTPALAKTMKKRSIIMHPLPSTFEYPRETQLNPRARHQQQMHNGIFVRAALLVWIREGLGSPRPHDHDAHSNQ
ncbi:MAG: aspartate carbamoyltransferase [Candidatus Kerfeldbacteria bacterium]|nr:aspartate carbamoyltransferase [Candidatus Kerfeldbacteria bacterium]